MRDFFLDTPQTIVMIDKKRVFVSILFFYCSWGYLLWIQVLTVYKAIIMIEKKYFKTKDYVKVKFTLNTDAKKVELLGLNNEWKKGLAMTKKKEGVFVTEVNLPKDSQHEFKYFVDKKTWLNDNQAEAEANNVFGTTNSIVTV
ncbi:MAG: hypothetical protein RLZ56_1346 [Bacteroidota bacterium]|jgi:hypothetical protein